MTDETAAVISIPLAYIGAEDVPILYANNFVLQFERDEFVLVIAQHTMPIILHGTDEEKREAVRKIPYVPVKVVARVAMSRARTRELRDLLDRQLEQEEQR